MAEGIFSLQVQWEGEWRGDWLTQQQVNYKKDSHCSFHQLCIVRLSRYIKAETGSEVPQLGFLEDILGRLVQCQLCPPTAWLNMTLCYVKKCIFFTTTHVLGLNFLATFLFRMIFLTKHRSWWWTFKDPPVRHLHVKNNTVMRRYHSA
jgi:hypothetical protein